MITTKAVRIVCAGVFSLAVASVTVSCGTSQRKANGQSDGRENRKVELTGELTRGLSQFRDALAFRDAEGDRGLSSLLRVAMEPDVNLIRSALVNRPKNDSLQVLAYYSLLAELVFETPKELQRPNNGGFSALDCVNGRLSIRYGWGTMGLINDPVEKFDHARKTQKRRNLDRFKGQL